MAFYNRQDMIFNDYMWSDYGDSDPRISGTVDETRFNRSEGLEVLYLINDLIEEWNLQSKSSCKKLEKMIRDHLPYNIILQSEVKQWLKDNSTLHQ